MTEELKVGLIAGSTFLSGVSVSVGFYLLHKKIESHVRIFLDLATYLAEKVKTAEQRLEYGIKTEAQGLHSKMELLDTEMHAKVEHVGHLVQKEAADLKDHAVLVSANVHERVKMAAESIEEHVTAEASAVVNHAEDLAEAARADAHKALSIFEHHSNDLKNHAAALKTNAQETQDLNAASSLSRFQRSVPSR